MGQAHSRRASDIDTDAHHPRRRSSRPLSWAPGFLGSPQSGNDNDTHPELLPYARQQHQHQHQNDRPRSSATRLSRRLSSHLSSHLGLLDAGPSPPSDAESPRAPWSGRSRARLTRARTSLSSMAGLLQRRPSMAARDRDRDRDRDRHRDHSTDTDDRHDGPAFVTSRASMTGPSALRPTASERGQFLPRVQVPELGLDFDQLLQANSPTDTDAQRPPSLALRRDGRGLGMLPSQRRLRNMIGHPRRRRSLWQDAEHMENVEQLRQGEDQADVLSRLLSLAAAATAASLVGDDHQAATRDGTFDTFLQSLQNGSIASALRGNEQGQDGDNPGANQAPLNFFRMFRFGTSTDNPRNRNDNAIGRGEGDEEGEGRLVPIIIVGIRSIQPGNGTGQEDASIPPFLDALSSFPTPPTSPGDTHHMLPPPQNGTRFSHRRRASMGGFNFPSNYDSQRHQRASPQDRSSPWSSATDSPSAPSPPPSTPATTLNSSAVPSRASTPATSTSPPSPTTQSSAASRPSSFVRTSPGSTLEPTVEEPQTHTRNARPRRLSESDFTRYGAGAPRRRGVVEPDNNPGEGSRSWIIYVLGGSYPENHPILTTPSLFTESPTYEDMMLLSSILGPAKPPVASEEDVASAPGLYRIRGTDSALVAEAVDGDETVDLVADARCLVCLCDFEADEEARKLVKCEHMFHKICIDQWLTTGRNSCPLCRGEGVHETAKEVDATTDAPAPSPPQAVA
ncbi:hypothetical protein PTNB85_03383 [Pyrenophora teres f. teres]|nr:hypothetical protein PTNB85_03383 [Pyrenophora teres f. teres]